MVILVCQLANVEIDVIFQETSPTGGLGYFYKVLHLKHFVKICYSDTFFIATTW